MFNGNCCFLLGALKKHPQMLAALIISPPAPDMLASSLSRALWPGINCFCRQAKTPPISRVKAALGHRPETPSSYGILPPPPCSLDVICGSGNPSHLFSTREIMFWANNWELTPRKRRPERSRARMLNGKLSPQHHSHSHLKVSILNLIIWQASMWLNPSPLPSKVKTSSTNPYNGSYNLCIHKIPDI